MNEPTEPPIRENAFSLVRWIALVLLAGTALAVTMTFVARSVTLRSPAAGTTVPGLDSTYAAPDFRLPALGGGELGPADYAGKIIVIDFWATWCGPCRLQAKIFEELHAEVDSTQVQFLAIDVAEDTATVEAFVAKTPFPYPVLLDQDSALSNRYPIHGLPTVMIIDKQGAVSYLHVGITNRNTLEKKLVEAGLET